MRTDQRWFLTINGWARHTGWAHPFFRAYAVYAGVGVLAVLLAANWWTARRRRDGRTVLVSIWAALGTLAAVGLNQPVVHAAARPRPYVRFPHAEVLVARAHDFSFPSDHAVAAGAVIAGLWLTRRSWWAAAATVLGLLLAFARVYVGVHYPGDVICGLLLGATAVTVLMPAAVVVLRVLTVRAARGPARPVVGWLTPGVSRYRSSRSRGRWTSTGSR